MGEQSLGDRRRAKAKGEALEVAALMELRSRLILAQRIATPSAMVRGRMARTAKVVGDIFGVTLDGIAVLVECKHRTGDDGFPRRPRPSDFEEHQVDALRQWHRRGALALVAYRIGHRVELIPAVEIVGVA